MTQPIPSIQQPSQPLNKVFMILALVLMTAAVGVTLLLAFGIMALDFPAARGPIPKGLATGRGAILIDPPSPVGAEKDVMAVLDAQKDAWNKGDLDGFMAGYSKKHLVYVSGGTKLSGFDALREHYAKRYPGKEGMGTLNFENVEVDLLDSRHATAHGGWKVNAAGKESRGTFSLTLVKEDGGWKVVHDHTSAEAPKS